ncbi:MAG: hypothetical protein EXR01_02790 [Acetobacteraceae bacterium]|nr:hypothetical protein [Acetobacteraceae bacterium]
MRAPPILLTLLLLLATPWPARADRPANLLPLRDIAVLYRVSGQPDQESREALLRYTAVARVLRLETPGRGAGHVLVDPIRRQAHMILPGGGQFIELPVGQDRRFALLLNPATPFTRRGTARIAGHVCTLWDVHGGRDSATLCLSAAGILLRAQATRGELAGRSLEAVRVEIAPQDPALFQLPAQARELNLQDAVRAFLLMVR